MKRLLEMFENKHNKLTLSKVVPFVWTIFIMLMLAVMFYNDPTHLPTMDQDYWQFTGVVFSVYLGRTYLENKQPKNKPNAFTE